jgi:hypothetical protein
MWFKLLNDQVNKPLNSKWCIGEQKTKNRIIDFNIIPVILYCSSYKTSTPIFLRELYFSMRTEQLDYL